MSGDYRSQGYNNQLEFGGSLVNSIQLSGLTGGGGGIGTGLSSGSSAQVGSSSSNELSNPTTDVQESSDIRGGDLIDGITVAKAAFIKGGADGYDDGIGWWIGARKDEVDFGFFIGNSAGNKLTYNTTDDVLTITGDIVATGGSIGGFDIGADFIRDAGNSFGLASTVTGGDDVRFWAGDTFANRATAPFRVTEAGDVNVNTLTATNPTTPESITVVGKLTATQDFTAGFDMVQGEVTSIESDSKVYPTRVFDFDELEDNEVETAPSAPDSSKTVRINRTVALNIHFDSQLSHQRMVYDPIAKTISSIADGNPGSSSVTTNNPNVIRMTDTTALTTGTATNTLYGRIITGLDSGVTYGTEMTIDSAVASGAPVKLVRVDDTHALCFYIEQTTEDIKVRVLTVSGSTVTAGAEQAVHTAVGSITFVQDPGSNGATRFGTSEYYGLAFRDGTTNQVIAVQWNGATLTAGTAINAGYTSKNEDICSLDDTRIAYGVLNGTAVEVKVISRSGTTLTTNSPTTVETATNANGRPVMAELGEDSCCIGWQENTGGGSGDFTSVQLVRFDGNTVTALGSSLDQSDLATQGVSVFKLTPELIGISQVGGSGGTGANITYNFRSMTNNYAGTIGIVVETIATDAIGGVVLTAYCDDVTGLTTAETYYLGIDGTLITKDEGGITKVGVSLSATEIKVTV